MSTDVAFTLAKSGPVASAKREAFWRMSAVPRAGEVAQLRDKRCLLVKDVFWKYDDHGHTSAICVCEDITPLSAELAASLEDFRRRHYMYWADPKDNDLVYQAVKNLEAPPQLFHLNSTGSVAVGNEHFLRMNDPVNPCPRGVKVQLLNRGGVAVYGVWDGRDTQWRGWYPIPGSVK